MFLVNSGASDFYSPITPLKNALYHNNHDGSFTDVTDKAGLAGGRFGMGVAVADFDGDSRPDMAITKMNAQGGGYVFGLELNLSASHAGEPAARVPAFPFIASSMFGVHLTPRDVDGDHDLDIVVTMGFTRQPVAVWINDGQGGFEEGDLAAYPALSCHDELLLSPKSSPQNTRALFDQSRRSWLTACGLLQPFMRSDRGAILRSGFLISRVPADRRSARAPPSVLA